MGQGIDADDAFQRALIGKQYDFLQYGRAVLRCYTTLWLIGLKGARSAVRIAVCGVQVYLFAFQAVRVTGYAGTALCFILGTR